MLSLFIHLVRTWHKYIPYCLKLWLRCLFLSSNFVPRPLYETSDYTKPAFINWSFVSKIFGQWILMATGHVRVADPLDTVHHEMDRVVCSNHVSKSVWSPKIGEQLVLEKEPAGQSTWWICSGSDKEFSDSKPHSVGNILHRSCGILLHEGGLLYTSVILLGEGVKEKA